MRRVFSYLLGTLLSAALAAQPPLFATMTANQPLVAAWLSAPAGTSTAIATQPAGGLLASSYVLEGGDGVVPRVRLGCDRGAQGPYLFLSVFLEALQPNELLVTQADITFHIAAPVGTVLSLRAWNSASPMAVTSNALWVDVDDDGSIEFDSGALHERGLTRVAGLTPLAVRVRSNWITALVRGHYVVSILVDAWHPAAQPAGDGCGNLAAPGPQQAGAFATINYQMAALPPFSLGAWLELIVRGYGDAGWFVFDQQSTMVPVTLPVPWGSCPVLASPFAAIPGSSIGGSGFFHQAVPMLPPGTVFYAQHAAFSLQSPFRFGTSNRIRIQS